MKDKIKVLFLISILLAFLFFVGPILLRFTWVRNIVSLYFDGLIENEYKSSYMSAIGGMVGTALTITGTLFLQCILDKKDRINKKLQEEKEIQYKIAIVYYDLCTALQRLEYMECAVQHADGKNIVYIELISNAGFDLDNEWRKSIISLSDVLEDEIVEKIFLTYKRLSALEYRIKTTDRENEMQMIQLAVLIGQFFNENEEKVKEEYRKLLDILREKGKIKRNLYES